jgi:hypothetical protein
MVKVPSERFKCGIIITPLTGFLASVWRSILSPFLVFFGSRNAQFYWVFCASRAVFGPFLSGISTVHLGSVLVNLGPVRVDFSSSQFSGTFLATWCPDAICVKRRVYRCFWPLSALFELT